MYTSSHFNNDVQFTLEHVDVTFLLLYFDRGYFKCNCCRIEEFVHFWFVLFFFLHRKQFLKLPRKKKTKWKTQFAYWIIPIANIIFFNGEFHFRSPTISKANFMHASVFKRLSFGTFYHFLPYSKNAFLFRFPPQKIAASGFFSLSWNAFAHFNSTRRLEFPQTQLNKTNCYELFIMEEW